MLSASKRPRVLEVRTWKPEIEKLAQFLHISTSEAREEIKDGRPAAWMTELLSPLVFPGYKKHEGHNVPISDGMFNGELVSVRVCTKHGIDFQQSKDKGVGRESNQEKLMQHLSKLSWFILWDVTDPDSWKTVMVSSEFLQRLAKAGILTSKGFKGRKMWNILSQYYKLNTRRLNG